jgi:phosphopantothenoylcysteine decarboxylase/phosphopantothenate--cysteine ligase
VVHFLTVTDLASAMRRLFPRADALVMAAAVGDFRPARVHPRKLRRSGGPITLRLMPTPDVMAASALGKRPGQLLFAFAVQSGPRRRIERQALAEMARKGADFVLLNTPAAMGADFSAACVLSPRGVLLPWRRRTKADLAESIVRLLESAGRRADGRFGGLCRAAGELGMGRFFAPASLRVRFTRPARLPSVPGHHCNRTARAVMWRKGGMAGVPRGLQTR